MLKALDALDEVIATIRKSRNADTARNNLIALLKITEIQAQAILDMQLRRLAALERKKIEDEYKEKVKLIKYLEGLLNSPQQMRDVIAEEVRTIKSAYSDPRRTIIVDSTAAASVTTESLMLPQEETWVTLTVTDKIARSFEATPPKITGDVKEPPRFIVESDSTQILYLFSTEGMCATIPVHQLPQVNDPAEGTSYRDLCGFKNGEQIAAVLSLPLSLSEGFLFFATSGGEVKRLRLEDLPGMMANTFKVMDVETDDSLDGGAADRRRERNRADDQRRSGDPLQGKSDVRATGIGAGGMRGIKLGARQRPGDRRGHRRRLDAFVDDHRRRRRQEFAHDRISNAGARGCGRRHNEAAERQSGLGGGGDCQARRRHHRLDQQEPRQVHAPVARSQRAARQARRHRDLVGNQRAGRGGRRAAKDYRAASADHILTRDRNGARSYRALRCVLHSLGGSPTLNR